MELAYIGHSFWWENLELWFFQLEIFARKCQLLMVSTSKMMIFSPLGSSQVPFHLKFHFMVKSSCDGTHISPLQTQCEIKASFYHEISITSPIICILSPGSWAPIHTIKWRKENSQQLMISFFSFIILFQCLIKWATFRSKVSKMRATEDWRTNFMFSPNLRCFFLK